MATHLLLAALTAAKSPPPALSRTNAVNVRNARAGRELVSDFYYARTISAAFRCASEGQQAALAAVIVEDGTGRLFRVVNNTLVAG